MPYYLAIQNIVRTFVSNKEERRIGVKEKQYTTEQEQIARFAKAMGHPARMAILAFLAKNRIYIYIIKTFLLFFISIYIY